MKVAGRAEASRQKVESSKKFNFFSLPAALGGALDALPEKCFESPILIYDGLFRLVGGVLSDRLNQLKKA
jgi:hypothetical protein